MHIGITPEQLAFQARVRALMAELMTDALRKELGHSEGGGPLYRQAMRRLGGEGWLGLGWPREVGGGGRPPIEEFLFFDEVHRSGFPIPLLTLNTVGPTLIHYGTDAQRAAYLPRILSGELHFSIGYTEPEAGTDLGSLSTRAVRDGDVYVVNGQKIWCSLADHADCIWLACRTDPDAPKHKGISILIVPTDSPGFSRTPIRNLGGNNVHAVYFEDVRVPVANRVGPEHGGWRLITTQLNHERVALMMVGPLERLTEETAVWAAHTADGDGVVLDRPWVRAALAEITADLHVLRLMNWKQAWDLERGQLRMEDASGIKVFGSELYVRAYAALVEVLGAAGPLLAGSPGAALRGQVEQHFRSTLVLTFGGGTNEIQRDIVAAAGMGLPRARR